MVRIGRPDRDTSLRKPLMRTLQTLRRYKLGTSPSLKAGLLRETLDPIVQHPGTKRLLSGMSPRGRPISPLLPFPSAPAPQLADNNMLAEDGSQLMPMTRSAPNLHASKIELEKEKERTLTVREISEVSLHRYHLSAQGRRSAQVLTRGHTGNNTMTDGLVTDSIDSSVLAGGGAGGEGEDDPNMNDEVPVLYDPATVRLPRMEIVPGFGSTTPLVESRLGAYHVHSNRAVSAAAALEDASLIEGSRALSMNSRQDDSYRAERVEAFYKSAETSHLDSLEQQAAHMQIQCPGGASVGSRSASSQESTIR